jgi:DNA-binding PadR family transcriptional regulator
LRKLLRDIVSITKELGMALGGFEQLIMLAALHLDREAYGVSIVDEIEARTGRPVSRSSLHITFDRLEAKGYLASELRSGDERRGGKLRRYVTVTKAGLEALRESRRELLGMWRGLGPLWSEGQ